MATVRAITEDDEFGDEHELHGQWWVPQDPSNRVGGYLAFARSSGAALTLTGALLSADPGDGEHTILGLTTENQYVTLPAAHWRGHSSSGLDAPVTIRQDWWAYEVLVGAAFAEGDAALFNEVHLSTDHLRQWIRRPIPHTERAEDGLKEGVSLELQRPVIADIGHAEVNVEWWTMSRHSHAEGSVTVATRLVARPKEACTLDQLWQRYVSPLVFFLTLATGSPQRVRHLKVAQGSEDVYLDRSASVLGSRWSAPREASHSRDAFRFPLPFVDVEPRYEDVIRRWFDIYATARGPILEFFTGPLTPHMYMEERFVRTVRALEMWHRLRHGGEVLPPEEFNALRTRINEILTAPERQLVMPRLQHGNEPSLKQRLEGLVEIAGPPLTEQIQRSDRLIRRVVNTRNSMTHGDQITPGLSDEEMFWAEKLLHAVFFAVLLRDLGYDPEYVAASTRRSPAWQYIQRIPLGLMKT